MITINNIEQLNLLLRTQLIKQSELDGRFVLNALSLYGEDLDKLLSETIYDSIESSNNILLFELISRNDGANINFMEEDRTVTYYKSYSLHIIIYGDESTSLINQIVSRFETSKVRNDLLSQGVYVEKISNPEKINEYKNQSMWIRNDAVIDISCRSSIQQVDDDFDYSSIGIDIIK